MTFTNNLVAEEQLPQYQEVELTRLPDAAKWTGYISWIITYFIVVIISVAGPLVNIKVFPGYLFYWLAAAATFVGLMMLWTAYSHRFKGYALREHDLIFKRGVIWQKTTILPFNRVQHVETQQGVLQRRFDLTTLNVFSAGGSKADLTIHGMDMEITEGIKSVLLARIQTETTDED